MTTLHLGVIDVPYSQARGRRRSAKAGSVTTGDVAGWLEDRYLILEHFWQAHSKDIAADLEKSIQGAVESLFMGAPIQHNPFGSGTSEIENRMKAFLSTQEIERIGFLGIPTQAALRGINHRKKHPYRKGNPRRPSFIDTGQMQASYKAWVEK